MKYLYSCLTILLLFIFTGCNSSFDSSDDNNTNTIINKVDIRSSTIVGNAVTNYIKNGQVTAYDEDNNTIATTKTDANGYFKLDIGNRKGIVFLALSNGTYNDEYSGKSIHLTTHLRSIQVLDDYGTFTQNITPLTELAYRKIKKSGISQENIKNIDQFISDIFSLDYNTFDILKTFPSTITDTSNQETKSKYYGLILAALSANGDLTATLTQFEKEFSILNNEIIDNGIFQTIGRNLNKLKNINLHSTLFNKLIKFYNEEPIITPNFDYYTNEKNVTLSVKGTNIIAYKYKLDDNSYSKRKKIDELIKLSDLTEGEHSLSIVVQKQMGFWQSFDENNTIKWENDYTKPIIKVDKKGGVYDEPMRVDINISKNDILYYSIDGSTPLKGTRNTLESNSSFSLFIDQPTTLQYYAVDWAKNFTEPKTIRYILPDKFAPDVQLLYPKNNSILYETQPVIQIEIKDGSGIDLDSIHLTIDDNNITNYSISDHILSYKPPVPFKDKQINISLAVKDTKGNAITKYFQFSVDSSPLKVTKNHENGFYDDPFYLKLNTNRPSKIYYTLDGSTPKKDQQNTITAHSPIEDLHIYKTTDLHYYAEDNYGNTTPIENLKFLFDKQAPEVIKSSIQNNA